MTIKSQIQKADPGAVLDLFILDTTGIDPVNGTIQRFYSGTNELQANVVWQGEVYVALPITFSDKDMTAEGPLSRPKLIVSNISGKVSVEIKKFNDLIGATLTRKQTFVKYLDPVNFKSGVNPDADQYGQETLPDDIFIVNHKVAENREVVEFELVAPLDIHGVKLPARQVLQACSWGYRSAECGYTGAPVADSSDNPTGDPQKDKCGKQITSCKMRYGSNNPLPFGGFPAAGEIG